MKRNVKYKNKGNKMALFLSFAMTMSAILPTNMVQAVEYELEESECDISLQEAEAGSAEIQQEITEQAIPVPILSTEEDLLVEACVIENDVPQQENLVIEQELFGNEEECQEEFLSFLETSVNEGSIKVWADQEIFPMGSTVMAERIPFDENIKSIFDYAAAYENQEVTNGFLYRIYILDEQGNLFETEQELTYEFDNLPFTLETENYDICEMTLDENTGIYQVEKKNGTIVREEAKAFVKTWRGAAQTSILGVTESTEIPLENAGSEDVSETPEEGTKETPEFSEDAAASDMNENSEMTEVPENMTQEEAAEEETREEETAEEETTEEETMEEEAAEEETTEEETTEEETTEEETTEEETTEEETAEEETTEEETAEEETTEEETTEEETTEEEAAEDETTEEEAIEEETTGFIYEEEIEGVMIKITAPEGTLPEETKVTIRKMSLEEVKELLEEETEKEGKEVIDAAMFDVILSDENDNIIQPDGNVEITISNVALELAEVYESEISYRLYKIKEEENIEVDNVTDITDVITFEDSSLEKVGLAAVSNSECKMPAFSYSETIEGTDIVITAEEGVLPEGTTVKIESMTLEQVNELIGEQIAQEGKELVGVKMFDVTLYDTELKEIQPEGNVEITFSNMQLNHENAEEAEVIRIQNHDTENKIDVLKEDISTNDEQVTFANDHFTPVGVALYTTSTSGVYRGFVKLSSDTYEDVERAECSGFKSVQKYYVVLQSTFDDFFRKIQSNVTYRYYQRQAELIEKSEIAYCYNETRRYPRGPLTSRECKYDEILDATPFNFYKSTDVPRLKNAEELYKAVVSVALNGYPIDYSGIQKKYNLSDDQFRCMTQHAIWYYTDTIAAPSSISNRNIKNAFNELLTTRLSDDIINNNGCLNLYPSITTVTKDDTVNVNYIGKTFQNLLSIHYNWKEIIEAKYGLTIQKEVVGKTDDTSDFEFEAVFTKSNSPLSNQNFTVKKTASNGNAYSDPTTLKSDANGKVKFTLKNGESIVFSGLEKGIEYQITEVNVSEEYSSSVTDDNAQGTINADKTVEFINTYVPPTVTRKMQGRCPEFINTYVPPTPAISVQIQARKTLDGEEPGDKKFKFQLLSADKQTVLQTKENDAEGNITFDSIEVPGAGTYYYYIREVVEDEESYEYDKEDKLVTVVCKESVFIEDNMDISAGNEGDDDIYIEVNGNRLKVYCMNGDKKLPMNSVNYVTIVNPTLAELKNAVRNNLYGNQLGEYLKKLTYYLNTHHELTVNGFTVELDDWLKQTLMWAATGGKTNAYDYGMDDMFKVCVEDYKKSLTYKQALDAIYERTTVPANYQLVIAKSSNNRYQTLITGFGADGTTVTHSYESSSNTPVFENKTKEKKASLKLVKVNGNTGNTETSLSQNVKFQLLDKDKTEIEAYKEISLDSNGSYKFENLSDGVYYLKETQTDTANRYQLLPGILKITVKDGVISVVGEGGIDARYFNLEKETDGIEETEIQVLTVKNFKAITVPQTGSRSLAYVWGMGSALVLAGIFLMLCTLRKKEK